MSTSVKVSLTGPLAQRFKAYLKQYWPGQQMAAAVLRRALKEFLDREYPWKPKPEGDKP